MAALACERDIGERARKQEGGEWGRESWGEEERTEQKERAGEGDRRRVKEREHSERDRKEVVEEEAEKGESQL